MTSSDWKQAVGMVVACAVFYAAGLMASSRAKAPFLSIGWSDLSLLKMLAFEGGKDGMFGLAISERMKIPRDPFWRWRTIYPTLHDLEDRGLIESWEDTPGPDERRLIARRLYRVSAYGLDLLTAIKKREFPSAE